MNKDYLNEVLALEEQIEDAILNKMQSEELQSITLWTEGDECNFDALIGLDDCTYRELPVDGIVVKNGKLLFVAYASAVEEYAKIKERMLEYDPEHGYLFDLFHVANEVYLLANTYETLCEKLDSMTPTAEPFQVLKGSSK